MPFKKYIGKIYEGRWKIIKRYPTTVYVAENIFNKSQIRIPYRTLILIDRNELTLSKFIRYKCAHRNEKYVNMVTNTRTRPRKVDNEKKTS